MSARLLFAAGALGVAAFGFACGGGSGGESGLPSADSMETATSAAATATTNSAAAVPTTTRPPSTGGTAGGQEPILKIPAAAYSIDNDDLMDGEYKVNPPETYIVNAPRFALLGQFQSGQVATSAIEQWGFLEGWNVQFDPVGQLSAVVDGGYYLTAASYLFETTEGAIAAYDSFGAQYSRVSSSQQVDAPQLGNASAGFSLESGVVGRSNLPNVYHRFLFRRGNMVAVVQVNGAGPYVSMDIARDYAVIIDDKALGKRPANLPTPIPTVQSAIIATPLPSETPTP